MSLKYEPSSELLHLSAKQLILNCNARHTSVSLLVEAILRALLAILRASCKGVLAILTATRMACCDASTNVRLMQG